MRRLLFYVVHNLVVMIDWELQSRVASPTAGVIDSQSVKASCAEVQDYDTGKKINGRKRHIAVDTDGHLLMVNLTTVDISNGAYDRKRLMDKAAFLYAALLIRRIVKTSCFIGWTLGGISSIANNALFKPAYFKLTPLYLSMVYYEVAQL